MVYLGGIGQNIEPTLQKVLWYWANFHSCNCSNINQNLAIWSLCWIGSAFDDASINFALSSKFKASLTHTFILIFQEATVSELENDIGATKQSSNKKPLVNIPRIG